LPLFPTVLQAHREDRVHPACLAIDVSTQTLCVHRTIYVTVTPGTTSRTRSVVSDFVLLLSKRFLPAFIDYGQGGGASRLPKVRAGADVNNFFPSKSWRK